VQGGLGVESLFRKFSSIVHLKNNARLAAQTVDRNDVSGLEEILLEHHDLIASRDVQGKTLLIIAIEKLHFDIGLFLVGKNPIISNLNDCVSRHDDWPNAL
jgi:hypothetical protein